MPEKYKSPKEYIEQIPAERQKAVKELRAIINKNIPNGFEECILYNMLGWVVPHSIYPDGYHCKPQTPLPFLNLANQKGYIALYHMGMYADESLLNWFKEEYPKHSKYKLDMGNSCIRFKKMDDLPYKLIGELISKMSVANWIKIYESVIKK